MTRYPICSRLLLALATCLLLPLVTVPAQAEETPVAMTVETPVAMTVEELRRQVIQLNRDLFVLEEDLLFPASTQFAVFLSVDAGEFLSLDSVKLQVGNQIVASHLYTERQVDALQRGGMQRLYMGNLRTGSHEVTVFVEGIGPEGRPYKKAATTELEKGTGTATLEVRIRDRSRDYEPAVELVAWE